MRQCRQKRCPSRGCSVDVLRADFQLSTCGVQREAAHGFLVQRDRARQRRHHVTGRSFILATSSLRGAWWRSCTSWATAAEWGLNVRRAGQRSPWPAGPPPLRVRGSRVSLRELVDVVTGCCRGGVLIDVTSGFCRGRVVVTFALAGALRFLSRGIRWPLEPLFTLAA